MQFQEIFLMSLVSFWNNFNPFFYLIRFFNNITKKFEKVFSKWVFVYATHQVPSRSVSDSTSGVKIGGLSANLSISYNPQQLAINIDLLILRALRTYRYSKISETYANHLRMYPGGFSSHWCSCTGWVICPIRGTYGPSFRSCQYWQRLFWAFFSYWSASSEFLSDCLWAFGHP